MSFKDWLTEQTKNRPNEQEIARKTEEWLAALDSLYTQMHTWLRQDDPEGLIKIWKASETIEEEELGIYSAPSLRFVMNHQAATVIPIARNVIGPAPNSGPRASLVKGRGPRRSDGWCGQISPLPRA